MDRRLKNKLIAYRGGGYDGCFWEWNYCFVDKDGKFYDIFSSGREGITTPEMLMQKYKNDDLGRDHAIVSPSRLEKEFIYEFNEGIVLSVFEWLDKNTDWKLPDIKCSECGHKYHWSELHASGYIGDGGIGLQATKMICEECNDAISELWTIQYAYEHDIDPDTGEITNTHEMYPSSKDLYDEEEYEGIYDAIYPVASGKDLMEQDPANLDLPMEGVPSSYRGWLSSGDTRECRIPVLYLGDSIVITKIGFVVDYSDY